MNNTKLKSSFTVSRLIDLDFYIKHKNIGIFLALLAVFQWAALGIFIKNIHNITTVGMVSGRLFFGALILLFIILSKRSNRINLVKSLKNITFYLTISFIMSAHFIFATMGYINSTIANASLLTNTMPIFVPILAVIFLSEKITYKEFIGITVAFIGIIIIFSSKGISFESIYFQGNIYALISAILLAIYTIVGSKNRKKHSALITMFWMCFMSSLIILITSFINNESLFLEVNSDDLLNLTGLTLVGTFGHLCYFMCLKHIKTTTASSIAMSTPIVAMIYASIYLSESYTIINVVGIFICLFGIVLTVKK